LKWLQPRSYHDFRCIGADCEDTCCVGWAVNVDQRTYEAYQRCDDPELGPSLHGLVVINAENASVENYAKITLSGSACPFLAEGLCSIQKKLGEEYLSIMCASYPRVIKQVDDVQQRSLDLSCPEAARLVLLDPAPIEFDETVLSTAGASSDQPYQYFRESRSLVIWLLQNRKHSLWKRLAILASLCDQLHAVASTGQRTETLDLLDACRDAVDRGLFDEALNSHRAQPAAQLGVVLELIVDRIGSDFTAPRFFECYREFMAGVDWTTDSSMTDLGRRYAAAHSESYVPLIKQHEYILEHYLVSYVHRTLFLLAPQESDPNPSVSDSAVSIRDQCLLMLAHYGIVQTILIGVAGFHGTKFDVKHVLKVIQSSAKTFEHSLAFPPRALQILAKKGIANCASLAILLLN
jgi:lysine-N-methylase